MIGDRCAAVMTAHPACMFAIQQRASPEAWRERVGQRDADRWTVGTQRLGTIQLRKSSQTAHHPIALLIQVAICQVFLVAVRRQVNLSDAFE